MDEALGEMLPIAVAIAVSPVPILAVILMLLSDREVASGIGFLAGWVLALLVIAGGVAALGLGDPDSTQDPPPALIAVQLALAAGLMAAAVGGWWRRPRSGEAHEAPRWMGTVRTIGPPRALALGVGLIAFNPKDGLLTIAAGARLSESGPALEQAIAAVGVFAVLASLTIVAPILAVVLLGARAEPLLERSRHWLERHGSAAVAAVLAPLSVLIAIDAIRYL